MAISANPRLLGSIDRVSLAGVVVVAAVWCWWSGWRGNRPFEDAAILFHYVDNVAAGRGVVWNADGAPVDGATDLGFMLILAVIRAVSGVGADNAALMANSAAFLLITAVLFVFARMRQIPAWGAVLVSGLFVFSPAVSLIHAGFGAVFFSATVMFVVLAMFRLLDEPTSPNAILLGCTGVFAGLVRPEGFLIAGLLITTAVAVSGRPLLRFAMTSAAVVALAGVAFVLWRWSYFGYPLPNPYYKKGGGALHLDGLKESIRFSVTVGFMPFLLVGLAGILGSFNRRWCSYICCLAGLLGMWALLSSEMNFNYRFQFPILVVALLMATDLCSRELPKLERQTMQRRPELVAPALVLVVVALQFIGNQYRFAPPDTGISHEEAVPEILARSERDDLVVATTESGYVCWKSDWKCVDLWGLNDQRIAHDGYLSEGQLGELNPDVIVLHAPTSPTATSINAAADGFLPGWAQMTDPLIRFAEGQHYVLAAILSPENDSGYAVYVRPGEDWSEELIAEFGKMEPTIATYYGPLAAPRLPTNS